MCCSHVMQYMMVPENQDIIDMYHLLLDNNNNSNNNGRNKSNSNSSRSNSTNSSNIHLLMLADYTCAITHACDMPTAPPPPTTLIKNTTQQRSHQHQHHGTLVWHLHGQHFDQDVAVMKEVARFVLLENYYNSSSDNNSSSSKYNNDNNSCNNNNNVADDGTTVRYTSFPCPLPPHTFLQFWCFFICTSPWLTLQSIHTQTTTASWTTRNQCCKCG